MWTYQRIEPTIAAGVAETGTTRRRATALLAVLLLAATVASGGCGESTATHPAASSQSSTTAAASNTTSTTPASHASSPAGSPVASATQPPSAANAGASAAGHAARKRAKVPFVLPPPGSHPEPKLSAGERATLPVDDISLLSAAIAQAGSSSQYTLAGRYTCHGADQSPPLSWSGIPADTRELALFVLATQPVAGKLYYNWAVAGIDPKLAGLHAGQLPPGASVGQNSAGHTTYTICPPAGKQESYAFILYALPRSLHPKPAFNPATLRALAKQTARHTGLLVGTNG